MAKLALLSLCMLRPMSAAWPSSLQEAQAEEARLDKVMSFANAQYEYGFNKHMTNCKAASENFKANCTDKGLTDKDCKVTTCTYCKGSSSHKGDEMSCQTAGSCIGHRASWNPDSESSCQSTGNCTGEGNTGMPESSEAGCSGKGLCNMSEHETEDSCMKAGGNWTPAIWVPATWVPATWTVVANVTDEAACRSVAGDLANWEERDATDSQCCKDGRLECGRDSNGEELESGCCDVCLNQSHPEYAFSCASGTLEGASVCGTTQGSCHYCANFPGRDNEGWCQGGGSCSVSNIWDENSCKDANGTWTVGVWSLNASATSEQACESKNYCAFCAGSGTSSPTSSEQDCKNLGSCTDSSKGDRSSCLNEGGNWTPAVWTIVEASDEGDWGSSEDACRDSGVGRHWVKVQTYESGEELPAAPMSKSSCSTGPGHAEPSHILPDSCIDADRFFKDAEEGKSVTEAMDGSCAMPGHANLTCSEYYAQVRQSIVAGAIVTNHANASERAEFTFTEKTCFVIVKNAKNKGKIAMAGTNKTFALVLNPVNYAGADQISFTGGNVAILGGTSAGPIDVSSPGEISVVDVKNEGPITVTGSQHIFMARVLNKAGATVDVDNVSATLVGITNEGNVTVKGGGTYKAWKIINKGVVRVEAGHMELELVCPSSGEVVMSDGVTGRVSYEKGCRGSLLLPTGVTAEEQGTDDTEPVSGSGDSDDNTTTGGAKESKITKFGTSLSMANASKFDKGKFLDALAETMGVNGSSIEVESISYEVKVGYSFPALVVEATAISAIANTTGVPKTAVSVVIVSEGSRRLAARRLSTSMTATIKTEDASAVDGIAAKLNDTVMLKQSLAAVGVEASPTVTAEPTKAVVVQTLFTAPGNVALEAPSPQQLSAAVSDKLGVDVEATVSDVKVTSVTDSPTSTTAGLPSDGDATSRAIAAVPWGRWAMCFAATWAVL
eukprot:TRINITY_DN1782_c0_g1_i1.p1 TRINITY_DN1782_c0_g1~~TRINITY_DN1782_c0_g1_i1.p1  ORF type:complete len:975 (-),score=178.26 TRINITY_DN1782_c0_g1_i1:91-2946(-)